MTRRALLFRVPAKHPGDAAAVSALFDSGALAPAEVVAILGKTEGNGCVNDFTRAYAVQALSLMLGRRLGEAPGSVAERGPHQDSISGLASHDRSSGQSAGVIGRSATAQSWHPLGRPSAILVPEVTDAGEDHRQPLPIGRTDHLVVAHGATRLDDGRGTGLGRGQQSIRKREEGIGGDDGAGHRNACHLGLDHGDAG